MIREYAVHPSLLDNWQDLRYFVEKFSVPQGRLISQFPKHWKRMVYEASAGCSPLDKSRITEKLKSIDARMIRRQRLYDTNGPWTDNAIRSNAARPFHAILCTAAVPACDIALDGHALDDANPLWAECRSQAVQRTAQDMADATATLLEISREIVFVDPYFRPDSTRFRQPLERFLGVVAQASQHPSRLEFHLGDGETFRNPATVFSVFENECQTRLERRLPRGLSLTFIRWKQASLHNRYILTERGAISFGTGLDAASGTSVQTDTISLLDEDVRSDLWNQYVGGTGGLVSAGDPRPTVVTGI